MSDEHGTVLSPADIGMPDSHPTTTEIHVEFAAVNGGTKMVMTHLGIPAGSPGAAGWAMAFAKLVAYVQADRKSVVEGKSVSVRVDPGGRRNIKKKKINRSTN